MSVAYRPSHADATYDFKYGVRAIQVLELISDSYHVSESTLGLGLNLSCNFYDIYPICGGRITQLLKFLRETIIVMDLHSSWQRT